MNLVFIVLGCLAVRALAQNSGQAALPPCILDNCEEDATKATGCADSDVYCHCSNQSPIYAVLLPCAKQHCSNPATALTKYNQLFGEACSQYNISVPAPGVMASYSNATGTIAPQASITRSNGTLVSTGTPVTSIVAGKGAKLTELKFLTASGLMAAAVKFF